MIEKTEAVSGNSAILAAIDKIGHMLSELPKYKAENSPTEETFEYLQHKVIEWADLRGLIGPAGSTPDKQFMKTVEELGELAGAIARGDREKQIDGVGDVMVTLIIACELLDLDMVSCLDSAYQAIANRKGKLVDGVFVKEDDLPVDTKGRL